MPFYAVKVDAPLPRMAVPLIGEEFVTLDLQMAYQETIEGVRAFRSLANYADLPLHFEAYSAEDQAQIQKLLVR